MLVSALSGTAGIRAYSNKEQAEKYFAGSDLGAIARKDDPTRVLSFKVLLSRAESGTAHMFGPPLHLTSEQRADIFLLNDYRDRSEHARPESWSTLNGFRLAISVDGTLTGRGGDIIIIDDPIAALAGALSEKAREHVVDWYLNTLLSPHDLGTLRHHSRTG
jgi:hypothetical protein